MREVTCQLLVIGAGPGGYVCAIRAGQLGIDTVIVEAGGLGGACLNVGCIPSKALIHAADAFEKARAFAGGNPFGIRAESPTIDFAKTVAWKDGIVGKLTAGVGALLKKAKVKTIEGRARFRDGKTVEVETAIGPQLVRAENVVIATGSAPVELPDIPFGGAVISSNEALSLKSVPETLAVVGAGYIGLEIGTAFAKLGAKVTVVELAERILPLWDADLTRPVAQRLAALGVEVLTGARPKKTSDGRLQVERGEGDTRDLPVEQILVTVGRRPVIEGWGLEELMLAMDGGYLRIDDQCRTSMRGIYAIGDVTGEPMLAHRAMAQGVMVAEIVSGQRRSWDKRCIPAICFTDPEVVTAGLSPEAAQSLGMGVKSARFPFQANGRALIVEREDGWVRVVSRADNDLILGVQAVGSGVAELASEFALALEMGATLEDLAATIHAHPTRGEAVQEAALLGLGHPLHV